MLDGWINMIFPAFLLSRPGLALLLMLAGVKLTRLVKGICGCMGMLGALMICTWLPLRIWPALYEACRDRSVEDKAEVVANAASILMNGVARDAGKLLGGAFGAVSGTLIMGFFHGCSRQPLGLLFAAASLIAGTVVIDKLGPAVIAMAIASGAGAVADMVRTVWSQQPDEAAPARRLEVQLGVPRRADTPNREGARTSRSLPPTRTSTQCPNNEEGRDTNAAGNTRAGETLLDLLRRSRRRNEGEERNTDEPRYPLPTHVTTIGNTERPQAELNHQHMEWLDRTLTSQDTILFLKATTQKMIAGIWATRGRDIVKRGPVWIVEQMAAALRDGKTVFAKLGTLRDGEEVAATEWHAPNDATMARRLEAKWGTWEPGDEGLGEAGRLEVDDAVASLFPQADEKERKAVMVTKGELNVGGHPWVWHELAGSREAWVEVVAAAVKNMKDSTAPGPSGLRRVAVKALLSNDGAKKTLAAVMEGLLMGGCRDILSACRLTLIKKPGGGYRPIGVGEPLAVLAKSLIYKCLERLLKDSLPQDGQMLLVPEGCRRTAQTVQNMLDRGWNGVQLDVKNAFNCVLRSAVIESIRTHAPEAEATVRLLLAPTRLIWRRNGVTKEWRVERGVVQGDPTSSVLFGRVMADVLREVVRGSEGKATVMV
ncbi:MAG: hypothetical protein D6722_20465, partial [Bacteroidetes bacterium]